MTTLLDWSARTDLIDLVPLAARTGPGSSSAFNVQPYTGRAVLLFETTAGLGAAATLVNLRLQDSPDGSTLWADVVNEISAPNGRVQFANAQTAASLQRISFDVGATRGFVRMTWGMTGTSPSFTFSCLMLARLT